MKNLDIRRLLISMISAADLLESARLDDEERRSISDIQRCNLDDADRLGIPYSVQNAALAAGRAMHRRGYASNIVDAIMTENAAKLTEEHRAAWKAYRTARIA